MGGVRALLLLVALAVCAHVRVVGAGDVASVSAVPRNLEAMSVNVHDLDDIIERTNDIPYPHRVPGVGYDAIHSPIANLMSLTHYVLGGYFDPEIPLRVLFLEGGGGDELVSLAGDLARNGAQDVEMVYMESRPASLYQAAARIQAAGVLGPHLRVRFLTGTPARLLPRLPAGTRFDLIVAPYLLSRHKHAEAILRAALTFHDGERGGGVVLRASGTLGMRGVTDVQRMMHVMLEASPDKAASVPARVAVLRRLLDELPRSHALWRSALWGALVPHMSDPELFNTFLHGEEHTHTIADLFAMADSLDLTVTGVARPHLYNALLNMKGRRNTLRNMIGSVPRAEKHAWGEQFRGNIEAHFLFLTHRTDPERVATQPFRNGVRCVPVHLFHVREAVHRVGDHHVLEWHDPRYNMTVASAPLTDLEWEILARCDSGTPLVQMHRALVRRGGTPDNRFNTLAFAAFREAFHSLFAKLSPVGRLELTTTSVTYPFPSPFDRAAAAMEALQTIA